MPLTSHLLFISYFHMHSHLRSDTYDSTANYTQSPLNLSCNLLNMALPAFCTAAVNAYRKRVLSPCHRAAGTCILVFTALVALHAILRVQVDHNQSLRDSLHKQLWECSYGARYSFGAFVTGRLFRRSTVETACAMAPRLRGELARARWVLSLWNVSDLCLLDSALSSDRFMQLLEKFVLVCIALLVPPFIRAVLPYVRAYLVHKFSALTAAVVRALAGHCAEACCCRIRYFDRDITRRRREWHRIRG